MTSNAPPPRKVLAAARSIRRARREEERGENQDRVLWLRLLTEGSRWSTSGGAFGGLLLAGGGICYALDEIQTSRSKTPAGVGVGWPKSSHHVPVGSCDSGRG